VPYRTVKIPARACLAAETRVGPPAYQAAEYTKVTGTNFDFGQWAFDSATTETIFVQVQVPSYYSGGGHKLRLRWKSSLTSGQIYFGCGIQKKADTDTYDTAFTSTVSGPSTAAGVVGDLVELTLTLPDIGMVAGDTLIMSIYRDVPSEPGTHAADALLVDIDWLVDATGPAYIPVRLATPIGTNIANFNATPDVLDGKSLAVGDLILAWQQTTASENGIYQVDTVGTGSNGVWTRSPLMDDSTDAVPGTQVFVIEGDQMFRSPMYLISTGTLTIGVSNLEFLPGRPLVRSDPAAIAGPTAVALTDSVSTTGGSGWIDVTGYTDIDVYIKVDAGTITGTLDELQAFARVRDGVLSAGAGQEAFVHAGSEYSNWIADNGGVGESADIMSTAGILFKTTPYFGTLFYHFNFKCFGDQMQVFVGTDGVGPPTVSVDFAYKRHVR